MKRAINTKSMRDVFLEGIFQKMHSRKDIFFLSADLGSIVLDRLRKKFCDRFINVGIAEQNLVAVAAGLALEGYTVYAYAIAPFLAMRAYEQIKSCLALLAYYKQLNVNLIGVGAGLGYDLSGATHHSLEDASIINVLPNIRIISPSDAVIAERLVDYSIETKGVKYFRLDGKPLEPIYTHSHTPDFNKGFHEFSKGKKVCLISSGFMTHTALLAAQKLLQGNIDVGVIDVFMLKGLNVEALYQVLKGYSSLITIEEGLIEKGGLDTVIASLMTDRHIASNLIRMGFKDTYVLQIGPRAYLHKQYGLDEEAVIKQVRRCL